MQTQTDGILFRNDGNTFIAKKSEKTKNKSNKSKQTQNPKNKFSKQFEQHIRIFSVLLFLTAVLIFLALISYTTKDEMFSSFKFSDIIGLIKASEEVMIKAQATHNWLGLIGASVSSFLYNSTIGFTVIILPVILGIFAVRLFKVCKIEKKYIKNSIVALLLATVFSGIAGIIAQAEWPFFLSHQWHGLAGEFIASVFSGLIGYIGSFLLLATGFVLLFIFATDIKWNTLQKKISSAKVNITKRLESLNFGFISKISQKIRSKDEKDEDDENNSSPASTEAFYEPQDPARILRRNLDYGVYKEDEKEYPSNLSEITDNKDNKDNNNDLDIPAYERKYLNLKPGSNDNILDKIKWKNEQPDDKNNDKEEDFDYRGSQIENARNYQNNNIEETINEPEQKEQNFIKSDEEPPKSINIDFNNKETIAETSDDINNDDLTDMQFDHNEILDEDLSESKESEERIEDDAKEEESIEDQPQQIESDDETLPNISINKRLGPENEFQEEIKEENQPINLLSTDIHDEKIDYNFPHIGLLTDEEEIEEVNDEELQTNARVLKEKLETFKIPIENLTVTPGPVVTQYEFVPAPGIKVSKIENLADDIAMALKARGIRIIAPVPGKGTVGIEIPNQNPAMVRFSHIVKSSKFHSNKFRLPIALGKTISGEVYCADLSRMPHLLIAGATGAGKSVGINTIISSLLFKMHPKNIKFVIIDPKKVEMRQYSAIKKHFLAVSPDIKESIITDPQDAVVALKAVCEEMDRRYDILAEVGQRNIFDYNKKVREGKIRDSNDMVFKTMPFIVVVIDELADLMLTASKEVEQPIIRIAQLARAVGIHLVIATQRPSVDVITGIIKANIPARAAYLVASKVDSRTILDIMGAEQLLGNGDMLFLPSGSPKPIRLQNSFISTDEVENLCNFISEQQGYSAPYELPSLNDGNDGGGINKEDRDDLFEEAARLVISQQQGSVSLIQRRLKVGYARAGRIIDELEDAGVVGPFDGSKARQVLMESEMELDAVL